MEQDTRQSVWEELLKEREILNPHHQVAYGRTSSGKSVLVGERLIMALDSGSIHGTDRPMSQPAERAE